MQKAIVAYPPETLRQHMLENQFQKVITRQGPGLGRVGLAVGIPAGDEGAIITDNVLVTDDSPVQVAREIFDCAVTVANILTLGHPGGGCDR